jgi:hypothetical protein
VIDTLYEKFESYLTIVILFSRCQLPGFTLGAYLSPLNHTTAEQSAIKTITKSQGPKNYLIGNRIEIQHSSLDFVISHRPFI